MLDNASKAFFHLLAKSRILKTLTSRYGMREADQLRPAVHRRRDRRPRRSTPRAPSRRKGCCMTLDYLGESVRDPGRGGRRDRASTCKVIDVVGRSGIERNLSLKLTQLGLDVDRATAVDNLRRILERGRRASSSASTWRTRPTPT